MTLQPQQITLATGQSLWAAGPLDLLNREKTAFFCSSQCPGSIILKTFDLMSSWREEGRMLAGGFHSPMEWECLTVLLRGRQPILWMPARHINGMRLKPELRPAFNCGRLLVLSPFTPKAQRITAALARYRNHQLAALSAQVFIAHAAPASQTLALCGELAGANKPLLTVDDSANQPLIDLGARSIATKNA